MAAMIATAAITSAIMVLGTFLILLMKRFFCIHTSEELWNRTKPTIP
jgi:hypothetical protein